MKGEILSKSFLEIVRKVTNKIRRATFESSHCLNREQIMAKTRDTFQKTRR